MSIKICLFLMLGLQMAIGEVRQSQKDLQALTTQAITNTEQYQATAAQMKADNDRYVAANEARTDKIKALAKARWLEAMETLKLNNYNQQRLTANREQFQGLLIFVSLGMPEAVLKALIKQADHLGIPVLIQGLLPGGFMATVNSMMTLITPEKKDQTPTGGMVIEPNWFKHFGITQVPAFVMTEALIPCITKDCKIAEYDVLYGNISLYDALRLFAQKGSPAFQVKAHGLLARSQGYHHA